MWVTGLDIQVRNSNLSLGAGHVTQCPGYAQWKDQIGTISPNR